MALSLRSNPSLHPSLFAPLVCPTPVGAPTRILSVTYSSVSLSQPLPFTLFLLPAGSRIANLSFRSTARSSPLLFIDLSPASTSPAQLHYTLSSMSSFIPHVSLYHRLSYSLTSGHLLGYLPLPANLSFSLPHPSLLFHSFLLPFLPHYPLFLLFFTNSLCLYFTLSAFFYPRCFVSRSLLLRRSPDDPSPSALPLSSFSSVRPPSRCLDLRPFSRPPRVHLSSILLPYNLSSFSPVYLSLSYEQPLPSTPSWNHQRCGPAVSDGARAAIQNCG